MYSNMIKAANECEERKYYWSPSIRWEKKADELRIEIFSYPDFVKDIFPKFYFLAQKGMAISELIKEFPEVESRKMNSFLQDLIKKRILINSILSPQEIFFPQNGLFKNEYSENIIYDAEELKKFKKKQLGRMCETAGNTKIQLDTEIDLPEYITKRRTYRTFDTNEKISFSSFSKLLSAFKQLKYGDEARYYYASAGGLYPIDVYIYIKDNRIENIKAGLYYYSPVDNNLCLVSSTCVITDDAHYFTNKQIYKESAFSVFFVYNAEVTMPKYGGMGYFYGCIDAGIMVEALTQTAELCNIGLCSIGDMNFNKIKKYFKLNENQVHIHTIEGGIKSYGEVNNNAFV